MTITRLNPYVNFNGDCSKAIALYQKALGAKVENLMKYSDLPGNTHESDNKDRVLHCQLQLDAVTLMVSDVPAERPIATGGNAHVLIEIDDAAAGAKAFQALAAGGWITVPLGPAFWGGSVRHAHRRVRRAVDGELPRVGALTSARAGGCRGRAGACCAPAPRSPARPSPRASSPHPSCHTR
jgi:PhnB protein